METGGAFDTKSHTVSCPVSLHIEATVAIETKNLFQLRA